MNIYTVFGFQKNNYLLNCWHGAASSDREMLWVSRLLNHDRTLFEHLRLLTTQFCNLCWAKIDYVGTETGFAKLFRWSWDLNTILKYPIPDLEMKSGRNRTKSDITFPGREISRIYRCSFSKFLVKKGEFWARRFWRLPKGLTTAPDHPRQSRNSPGTRNE